MESLFYEPETVDLLFLVHKDFIISTFGKIWRTSPPLVVDTSLARISLFPNIKIASFSLEVLFSVIEQDLPALTLLPSPIFPSSSPHQQYSGLSFLTALTKKLRTFLSEFRTNHPTDPSTIPTNAQLTIEDQFFIARYVIFCTSSIKLSILHLKKTPPNKVDSAVIRESILLVKEALRLILNHLGNIDNLNTSLPSDSSPSTPLVSGGDTQTIDSLKQLRSRCELFVNIGWNFFLYLTFKITDPHEYSFQTSLLDDPSFPDLILNSLKFPGCQIRYFTIMTAMNIVIEFGWMREKFMTANLVGRMFETDDFDSLPLLEPKTLLQLAKFIGCMLDPSGDDEEARFEQYPLIRVSVFEPAKQFLIFIFHNSDNLILDEKEQCEFERCLCMIHNHLKDMELRFDELDTDVVSELVKWEVRQMVKVENEETFETFFESMLNRTSEWNQDKRERQKRREALLREEGWDDAFELRVVGIEADTLWGIVDFAEDFSVEMTFNSGALR
ncbi:hypothetical protein BLNAU_14540 [Blattamonas nauphoetae]|uniref:Uncharacterized protein n=1 Tax=Blattamonas nauphoetae TaxID=2049346 RepID=A0ABQ9XJW7_9EUKA|nr:hypothetical protein BLNAU_14540 [Blattamonas nauphoetae]